MLPRFVMAKSIPDNRPAITLAERFDQYCTEVEQIVSRGIEHPRFELKREVTISRENLADRLDFVKLVQGLANAHIAEERFKELTRMRALLNSIHLQCHEF